MTSRIHPIVDTEVTADQVSTHGGILACKHFVTIGCVGMVFAIIDANNAGITRVRRVRLVQGLWPLTTLAKTWVPTVSRVAETWLTVTEPNNKLKAIQMAQPSRGI